MLLVINNTKVRFIGDPHFGKKFPNIPLHRQGERETQQLNKFIELLMDDSYMCVMVGDLFDIPVVDNECLLSVYNAISNAAQRYTDKQFVMLRGNHDIARNTEIVTSFDILTVMCAHLTNVKFVPNIEVVSTPQLTLLACPYPVFNTAKSEVENFKGQKFDFAVGHWDMDVIAGEHNLCPFEELAEMTKVIVSGHVHVAEELERFGATVHRTGSMLPYAHGEDPSGEMYVSHTLEQIAICLEENPHFYHNKCLRVLLFDDEQVPANMDCLQLTSKRLTDKEQEKLEVKMEDTFSFEKLFYECMSEQEVPEDVAKHYWGVYKEKGSADAE